MKVTMAVAVLELSAALVAVSVTALAVAEVTPMVFPDPTRVPEPALIFHVTTLLTEPLMMAVKDWYPWTGICEADGVMVSVTTPAAGGGGGGAGLPPDGGAGVLLLLLPPPVLTPQDDMSKAIESVASNENIRR